MRSFLRFIIAFSLLIGGKAIAQPLPCPPINTSLASAGADVTICPGSCANLVAFDTTSLKSTTSYAVDTTTYLPYNFNFGTTIIVAQDDIWSPKVGLPFSFCYFGIKYDTCIIGANGQIGFNTALAGQGNPWAFSGGVPGINGTAGNGVLNAIMSPFHDMNPALGGVVKYATYGLAPCRTFVVSWDSIPMFQCTNLFASQQIVLYETTYAIDIFIRDKPLCSTWNGGGAVLGIQNASGTLSFTVTGKNGSQWTEQNKGYRFTPSGAATKTYKWTNLANGQTFSTNPTATVCPPDTNLYELSVTWSSQCDSITLKDTVRVNVEKAAVADFSYVIKYGCDEDTVEFTNLSTQNTFNTWNFADGTGDTAVNPVHIYTNQGTFNVKLVVSNGNCKDSITKTIDTQHPLSASFSVDDDSVCQQSLVSFTGTSTYSTILGPAHFAWVFGDGAVDTGANATHFYTNTGVYNVQMIVTDFVPCSDTAYHIVVVDTIPTIDFTLSDSVLCEGKGVYFIADYSTIGNTGIQWEFGDGNVATDIDQILHAYDSSGVFTVKLTGTYRICPDATITKNVDVTPFPSIDLGPDTTLCPNGRSLVLADYKNAPIPGASWVWNTGESASSITVRHPGIYTAKVSVNGCENSDSIEVFKDCYIDIPNSFTPNGDGTNDYFLPRQLLSKGLTAFKMTVYNRWGQEIFQTTSINGRGWDGKFNEKEQPTGVYVYIIDAVLKNGGNEHYQGNVTLLR